MIRQKVLATTCNKQLRVDLAIDTGALCYGATGFLYGMSHEGIPSDTMLAALKPQVLAQKAPDGIQHPGGDALEVAPQFFRNGGKEVEIYMQDFYASWPYPYNMEDYLRVAAGMARKIAAHPDRRKFVYVPLNEPDSNGYNKTDRLQLMFEDWRLLYDTVRKEDPGARIAGPGFAVYDSACYGQFLTFCRDNHCLPDQMVWHELDDSFYTGWYDRVRDYRSLEASRGIAPIPIVINEYVKNEENLGIPGILVQHITRFENSKVDACLAYWCKAGGLNDLVTWSDNKATGGWWVFKWYGEMTGHTVEVTPPDPNARGLSGFASLDDEKRQVRIIMGGAEGEAEIVVSGFSAVNCFEEGAHVTVWAIDDSGKAVSKGPYLFLQKDCDISGGEVRLLLDGLEANAAYHLIITPASGKSAVHPGRVEAEYAKLSGTARVRYGDGEGYSGTGYVDCSGDNSPGVCFVINKEEDGYYKITLRYSTGPVEGVPEDRNMCMQLNGAPLKDMLCGGTPDWNTWRSAAVTVFLQGGINRIEFTSHGEGKSEYVHIDCIDVEAWAGVVTDYEAEGPENTLGGIAHRALDTTASGGGVVTGIGAGPDNYLQFNQVYAPEAGIYRMVVRFANNERGSGAGGADIVDRYAAISVNGGSPQGYYFRYTEGWSDYRTKVVNVELKEGNNTIRFSNGRGYVDLALVEETPPEGKWSPLGVENPGTYRYLRYTGPDGGHCNIAEMEFYNPQGEKLTGTAFGTTPSNSPGFEYYRASDGDTATAFDYAGAKCGYTGIDLGEGNAQRVGFIKYYPREGYAHRMAGGKFQGSNDNRYESCWAPNIDKISIARCLF